MSELKFTKEHEWLSVEGGVATVGITDFAQSQLGDIVFVELPEQGQEINQGEEVVTIESVKAAGEIHAPFAGTVIELNEQLVDAPDTVNEDPTGEGWFYKVKISGDADLGQFMSQDQYDAYLDEC